MSIHKTINPLNQNRGYFANVATTETMSTSTSESLSTISCGKTFPWSHFHSHAHAPHLSMKSVRSSNFSDVALQLTSAIISEQTSTPHKANRHFVNYITIQLDLSLLRSLPTNVYSVNMSQQSSGLSLITHVYVFWHLNDHLSWIDWVSNVLFKYRLVSPTC